MRIAVAPLVVVEAVVLAILQFWFCGLVYFAHLCGLLHQLPRCLALNLWFGLRIRVRYVRVGRAYLFV